MDKEKTIVVFRKFYDGNIIALFPSIPADAMPEHCQSYQHVGQHGAANFDLIYRSSPATAAEAAALTKELKALGYNLQVKRKILFEDRWYVKERGNHEKQ